MNNKFEAAYDAAMREFPYLGSGRHRDVFDLGSCVLKLPQGIRSEDVNREEHECRNCGRSNWYMSTVAPELSPQHMADCVLVEYHGVQALLMEKLRKPEWTDERHLTLPAWFWRIDGNQGGWDAAGEWKLFDYGAGV